MEFLPQVEVLLILAVVAMLAGFLDTLAGGGGLIVIPALLLVQIPPIQAIATNKLQGSFGTLTATVAMLHKKAVTFAEVRIAFFTACFGALVGAWAVQYIPAAAVQVVVPAVLAGIALYFIFAGKVSDRERPRKIAPAWFNYSVVPLIGLYDGAFGPGAGSFYTLANVALLGRRIIHATAAAKVLNFGSNIAALAVFILAGEVLWVVGGVMIIGTMTGAWLGSLAVIHRGETIVRPLIVVMSLSMLGFYLLKTGIILKN